MASKIINNMRKVIGPCKTGNDGYVWFEDGSGEWLSTEQERRELIEKLKQNYEYWYITWNDQCHEHLFVYRDKAGKFSGLVVIGEEHRDDCCSVAISLFTYPFLKTEEEMVNHMSKKASLVKVGGVV